MRSAKVVQQMIEWIEANMEEGPTLQNVSAAVWYCSEMFHDITGFTMKSYIAGRRLARITEEIREFPASDYLVFSYQVVRPVKKI